MANRVDEAVPRWRFRLLALVLSALALLLVSRALTLQVLETGRGYQFLQGQGNARTIRTETMPAHRGMIADRNGQPLAVSTPVASIWANPQELIEAREDWPRLAEAVGIDYDQLQRRLKRYSEHQFMYLRRQLAPAQAQRILAMNIPGVYMQREYQRFYPAGEVAAHLVGFTNIDERGQEGLEFAYDDWLRGRPGSKKVLKDLRGNIIRELDAGKPATPGQDLHLSIDLRLQYLAYRELKAALRRYGAKAGSLVMLDSETGEVLAMVNQPSYNPNNRSELHTSALRNRAITDMFEPGSTMKPLTMVAALESGQYTPKTTVDTRPGYVQVGAKTILDPVDYGVLDMSQVIQKSSQVGISKVALDLDQQSVWEVFRRFGLGRSTGSGFPGESNGMLPNRPRWAPVERVNFAFGYGLTVTALQLAQAYTVFATGGVLRPVTLLRQEGEPPPGERVVDRKTVEQVVSMLESVTQKGGTATRAQVRAYRVAGKTGTVHKVDEKGYADHQYQAIFVGMAPVQDPRVVTVVSIDEPTGERYHGGQVAAPVFAKVTGDAMRLLNVAPDAQPDKAVAGADDKKPPNSV